MNDLFLACDVVRYGCRGGCRTNLWRNSAAVSLFFVNRGAIQSYATGATTSEENKSMFETFRAFCPLMKASGGRR